MLAWQGVITEDELAAGLASVTAASEPVRSSSNGGSDVVRVTPRESPTPVAPSVYESPLTEERSTWTTVSSRVKPPPPTAEEIEERRARREVPRRDACFLLVFCCFLLAPCHCKLHVPTLTLTCLATICCRFDLLAGSRFAPNDRLRCDFPTVHRPQFTLYT